MRFDLTLAKAFGLRLFLSAYPDGEAQRSGQPYHE